MGLGKDVSVWIRGQTLPSRKLLGKDVSVWIRGQTLPSGKLLGKDVSIWIRGQTLLSGKLLEVVFLLDTCFHLTFNPAPSTRSLR